uniref:Uncharacterized protein n=1 Tax=Panagrolaimus sp. JU765 TaxID=591449 RepID=A0AC34RE89_9BILA
MIGYLISKNVKNRDFSLGFPLIEAMTDRVLQEDQSTYILYQIANVLRATCRFTNEQVDEATAKSMIPIFKILLKNHHKMVIKRTLAAVDYLAQTNGTYSSLLLKNDMVEPVATCLQSKNPDVVTYALRILYSFSLIDDKIREKFHESWDHFFQF